MAKAYELCRCHEKHPGKSLCPRCEGWQGIVVGPPLAAITCPTCKGTGLVSCPYCGRMSGPECAPGIIGMEES